MPTRFFRSMTSSAVGPTSSHPGTLREALLSSWNPMLPPPSPAQAKQMRPCVHWQASYKNIAIAGQVHGAVSKNAGTIRRPPLRRRTQPLLRWIFSRRRLPCTCTRRYARRPFTPPAPDPCIAADRASSKCRAAPAIPGEYRSPAACPCASPECGRRAGWWRGGAQSPHWSCLPPSY